jgi:hypothetical protein
MAKGNSKAKGIIWKGHFSVHEQRNEGVSWSMCIGLLKHGCIVARRCLWTAAIGICACIQTCIQPIVHTDFR